MPYKREISQNCGFCGFLFDLYVERDFYLVNIMSSLIDRYYTFDKYTTTMQ